MPDLERIRAALGRNAPRVLSGPRHAAVAMVLRDTGAMPGVLFIERAEHPADPWSGHMAFPGGRVDPGDGTPRAAAERETLEEVGVDLSAGELLGRLDDLEGRHAGRREGLVISAFVYRISEPPPLQPNYEVREALWVPLCHLLDPERHVDFRFPRYPASVPPFPGIVVGHPERQVVWGLTYRFLEDFFETLGMPLAERRARRRA